MKNKSLQLIKPITKKDQMVTMIKEAILSGALEPGAPLVESKIAQEMGVGTPLAREALIELEHQGFVQKLPFKGTHVTELGPADLDHIFNLRVELEPLAIEWAKRRATSADLNQLRVLVEGMRRGAQTMDLDLFYENDLAFHRKIWEMSGNPYLVDVLERLVVPIFAFFLMRRNQDQENYLKSADEHGMMIDNLLTFDAVALRTLVKETMTKWKDKMQTRLFVER